MNINKLKELLKEKKMTQKELAANIGENETTLSQALLRADMKVAIYEKIVKHLGISADYLIDNEDNVRNANLVCDNSVPIYERPKKTDKEIILDLKARLDERTGQVEYFRKLYEESLKNHK